MPTPVPIPNPSARRMLIRANGLAEANDSSPFPDILQRLGMVQLDTIRVISRAHHHILWSRNRAYRERDFDRLLKRDRAVFEHFTHDASILPMPLYPYWRRQFARCATEYEQTSWGQGMAAKPERDAIVRRIAEEGALSTKSFSGTADKSVHSWMRPPHKLALDYLWHTGELSISHRRKFVKFYDLTDRVIPAEVRSIVKSEREQIDHLCEAAQERLVFATQGQIQKFWEAVTLPEVREWIERERGRLVECEVERADGSTYRAWAFPEQIESADLAAPVTSRMRVLSPFDPLVRDRKRLEQIFGYEFRIEIFVPAAKRQYGYYVFPLLEGDRFVGRIEAVADRKTGRLSLENVWMETAYRLTAAREKKLNLELSRLAKLAECHFEP